MNIKFKFVFFTLIILMFLSTSLAYASHPYNDPGGRHMKSLHSSTDSEYWCADVTNTSRVTLTTANDTLWTVLNDSTGWDQLSDKVWFVGSYSESGSCSEFSSSYLATRVFRYIVYNWPEDFSGGSTQQISCSTNCVTRSNPTYVNNHNHYDYGVMNLKHTAISTTSTHTINHETGHILGLKDGDGTCTPVSIMHSVAYGCSTNPAKPTSSDISAVNAEADKN